MQNSEKRFVIGPLYMCAWHIIVFILFDDDFEIKLKYYSFIIVSSCFDSYLGFPG